MVFVEEYVTRFYLKESMNYCSISMEETHLNGNRAFADRLILIDISYRIVSLPLYPLTKIRINKI